MKPNNSNQGEGDKRSARHYNQAATEFVADGKVESAAADAKDFVETEPAEAARAEAEAEDGPHGTTSSLDGLVAKGRAVVDRVRPLVERATDKIRERLHTNTKTN